jgi:two-component system, OmpR family, sensor histidine kinase CiaH
VLVIFLKKNEMFRQLRLKFTFSILLVLLVFLSFLSSGLYFGTKTIISTSSKGILEKSAEDIIYGNVQGLDYFGIPPIPNRKNIFDSVKDRLMFNGSKLKLSYAIYDQSLDLVYVKNNSDISFDKFEQYVLSTYRDKNNSFITDTIDDVEYRIYTVFFNHQSQVGVIQLYQDISMEIFILNHLKRNLIIMSGISLLILTLISWFLAGISIKPVQKSWENQKSFLADASHELRTPIAIIQTNLDAAMSDPDGTISENERWLNNAYSESQLMGKLVGELLILAQIDANQVPITMQDMDLSEVCANTIEKFDLKANEKQIDMIQNLEKNLIVLGDSPKISQLVTILIDNAIKYSHIGGEIRVTLKKEKGFARLIVEDDGIGLDPKDHDKIFERFYRADQARHREDGGTGLGLSIAKWIVENHKGHIDVSGHLGKGTRFTIEIPLSN